MRVAIVTAYFPPHKGGQERHVLDLARGLSGMGHEVTVVTSVLSGYPGEVQEDFRVVWLPSCRIGSDALTFGLGSALARVGAEIVHVHSPLSMISTLAAASHDGAPMVVTYHGDFFKSGLLPNAFKRLRNRVQLPFVLDRASAVIALTRSDASLLASYGHAPEGIDVIAPGMDLDRFAGVRENGTNAHRKLLYVGRVVYQKGVMELVRSFASLHEKEEDVELVVAGDGDDLEGMRRTARDLGVEASVSFRGWVDRDELIELYHQSTAVVLPSYSEGMPYAVLEAMAAGRPVVSSRVSGMEEVVEHGVNGLLYDLGDEVGLREAMLRLLRDPGECQRMGRRAREDCRRRFSQERWLEDTVGVYERSL
jgi:glycosyltransferase involved in cell wall biosynthesis